MVVGNGVLAKFWSHIWIGEEALLEVATVEHLNSLIHHTVKDMCDINSGWKYELFADFLPKKVFCQIASHELIEDNEAVDEVYWNGAPLGGLSRNSAMKILKKNAQSPNIEM